MTVWTEEVIENTIFELMKDIGIEDELAEAAIDMMIDKIQRFEPDDIEWDTEVMEGTE